MLCNHRSLLSRMRPLHSGFLLAKLRTSLTMPATGTGRIGTLTPSSTVSSLCSVSSTDVSYCIHVSSAMTCTHGSHASCSSLVRCKFRFVTARVAQRRRSYKFVLTCHLYVVYSCPLLLVDFRLVLIRQSAIMIYLLRLHKNTWAGLVTYHPWLKSHIPGSCSRPLQYGSDML